MRTSSLLREFDIKIRWLIEFFFLACKRRSRLLTEASTCAWRRGGVLFKLYYMPFRLFVDLQSSTWMDWKNNKETREEVIWKIIAVLKTNQDSTLDFWANLLEYWWQSLNWYFSRKISQHLINHRKLLLVYLFPFCQCLFDNNSIDTQATHHWFLGKESRGSKSS